MADDLKMLADVEVLSEHGLHPRLSFLDLLEQQSSEILVPEPLEVWNVRAESLTWRWI
jgi:hypothetical protein